MGEQSFAYDAYSLVNAAYRQNPASPRVASIMTTLPVKTCMRHDYTSHASSVVMIDGVRQRAYKIHYIPSSPPFHMIDSNRLGVQTRVAERLHWQTWRVSAPRPTSPPGCLSNSQRSAHHTPVPKYPLWINTPPSRSLGKQLHLTAQASPPQHQNAFSSREHNKGAAGSACSPRRP